MMKDQLADSLAYNNLKVCILSSHLVIFVMMNYFVVILIIIICMFFVCQGLILSKALKAQKDAKVESNQIVSGTIIRGTLKTPNSQLVTPISIKLQRPDGCD
jgi:hypothetical protein